jgi:FAD/FMN-containing dehydrogenase
MSGQSHRARARFPAVAFSNTAVVAADQAPLYTPNMKIRTLEGSDLTLSPAVIDGLRAAFQGNLLTAYDPGYDAARRVWNGMFDRRPALILRCRGTADVVRAVLFVREHRLLVSVRGGGHSIAGLGVCDGGVVIDLSPMRGVLVDPARRTARAQAGCTLGDVDRETQLHGLAAVLGMVSDTGIAGLTLGGGFGWLTRRHGWTADTLVSMEVVLADGEVVRASADERSELFWALRGGGGNFGVVTSFEYQLYPVGPPVTGGLVLWRGEEAPEVLTFYRELTRQAPRSLTLAAVLRPALAAPGIPAELVGRPTVGILLCQSANDEDAMRLVASIREFRHPVVDNVTRRPYQQLQRMLDAGQPAGRRYYFKSEYLRRLDQGLLDALVEHGARIRSPHSAIQLIHLAGALNERPAHDSPVGNRDAAWVVAIGAGWEHAAEDGVNVAWARTAWRAIRPYSTGGVYVNFLTEDDGPERVEAAYGARALEKLAALKRTLDPLGLFRHTKGVLERAPRRTFG